jgi:uncharacterized protein YecE (DUF72 family)
MSKCIRIGTAGWAIPRAEAEHFPKSGSSLTRYASKFGGAEINSTFRKDHRPNTLVRWAGSVGTDFRFSVKMPKKISHELRLQQCDEELVHFAALANRLGTKLGPWLLQLPPSLAFDAHVAESFFSSLRKICSNPVVLEPRHLSWFDGEVDRLLNTYEISRAAADPARAPTGALPGGATTLAYYRLHGAPRMYYSSYDSEFLKTLAESIYHTDALEVWCIFDNTASGAATANAACLQACLKKFPKDTPGRPTLPPDSSR